MGTGMKHGRKGGRKEGDNNINGIQTIASSSLMSNTLE
jgi:hypothetical protein